MANPTLPSSIEFVNKQEQEYFAQAMIGENVREFLVSETGKFLHGCAKQEYDRCRDEAFELDVYTPEGKRKLTELKLKAQAASYFMRWCSEALQVGDQAAAMLKNYRDEN